MIVLLIVVVAATGRDPASAPAQIATAKCPRSSEPKARISQLSYITPAWESSKLSDHGSGQP
jgi:hypothetical protein